MNEPYRTDYMPRSGQLLRLTAGFGTSIVAGGLFSYIVLDLTAPHYLLELLSLVFVETPFIALFALLARKNEFVWFLLMAVASLIMSAALYEPHVSLTPLIYLKVIATGYVAGRFDVFGSTFFRRMTAMVTPGFIIAITLGGPILYGDISSQTIEEIRTETLEVYQAFMTDDDAQNAVNNAMSFFQSIFSVAVAFFMIFSVIEAWLSLQLAGWLFGRFGEAPIRVPPFQTFKLPFHMVWFFLVGGLVTFADIAIIYPPALNVFTVMCGLYGIQGLAIVATHSGKASLGRLPKIVFWVIFFLTIGFTGFLLIIAGILDNWFNLRSFPASPGGEREGNTDEDHFT